MMEPLNNNIHDQSKLESGIVSTGPIVQTLGSGYANNFPIINPDHSKPIEPSRVKKTLAGWTTKRLLISIFSGLTIIGLFLTIKIAKTVKAENKMKASLESSKSKMTGVINNTIENLPRAVPKSTSTPAPPRERSGILHFRTGEARSPEGNDSPSELVKTMKKAIEGIGKNAGKTGLALIASGNVEGSTSLSDKAREFSSTWPPDGDDNAAKSILTAYHFKDDNDGGFTAIGDNKTTGTTHVPIKGDPRSGDLCNVYVQVTTGGDVSIRHGTIKTERQAKQFLALINKLRAEGGPLHGKEPCRIHSLSLLSPSIVTSIVSKEVGMTRKQNHLIAWVNDKLGTDVTVVHMNYAFNAVSETRLVGAQSENESRSVNRQAYRDYSSFISTDLTSHLKEIIDNSDSKTTIITSLGNITSMEPGEGTLADRVIHLETATESLKTLIEALPDRTDKTQLTKDLVTLRGLSILMKRQFTRSDGPIYLAAQKENSARHPNAPRMSRTSEVILLSLVTKNLGIVEAVNCKSGCDRTGAIHAASTAMAQMLASRPDDHNDIMDMIMNFEALTDELLDPNTTKTEQHILVEEFRNATIYNMLKVGRGIIALSTGVEGFKYGTNPSSGSHNPHIARLLPRDIKLPGGIELQLTENKNGKCVMTEIGMAYLIGASQYRGT